MCNAVRHSGRWYCTPADLAELVGGGDRIVWQETNPFPQWPGDQDWRRMDLCLCPVDLEATLTNAGITWTRGVDPMEWFAESPAA